MLAVTAARSPAHSLAPQLDFVKEKKKVRGQGAWGAQARVFQNSKCALSGSALELPAVHFLCGHSFNVRSLGDNERECPLCAPQFRTILDIRRSIRASATEQVCSPSRRPCRAPPAPHLLYCVTCWTAGVRRRNQQRK